MDPFIKEKQYPVLRTQTFYSEEHSKWITILTKSSQKWVIPLTYTTPPYNDFKKTVPLHYLEEFNRIELSDSEKKWIIFNLQQTGYYRVNYNFDDWIKIENYLNSDDNYKEIHVLNRAQIIDDAFYFVTSGKLHSSVLWKLTKYLQKDNKYVAWYPIFKIIERLSFIIPYHSQITYFKETILELLTALLYKIGYMENDNDDPHIKCLRQEAAKWACVLGDRICKKKALFNLKRHLANQTHNKLLPWWKKWTYCNGLSVSHIPFDNVFNNLDEMLETENPETMETLACSNNFSDLFSIFFQLQMKQTWK
ncbi:aminopeptidase N-like [Pogonomyrmex barbatus]|uniref:Aminopeptidase N-like n=1 Tax=Pogonomyrmex barbatus TaxID=144034 RepID=A0A8N1SAH5_9HYME|nr:aminopeptidase N-like [Pogonomyrmex barbatus]